LQDVLKSLFNDETTPEESALKSNSFNIHILVVSQSKSDYCFELTIYNDEVA
jgi:hypothetical protein